MKTLSEVQHEQRDAREGFARAHAESCRKLLEASANVAPFKPEAADVRYKVRQLLMGGDLNRVTLYNTACDHCRTQLVNPEPGSCLLSNPPQYRAACPGCGWWGSVPTTTP